jgi:DNA polymerase-3 subunit delta
MEIRSAQAAAFLARPDPAIRTILLFGPDAGLVAERADQLAARLSGGAADDPFAVVTLDADALASDPSRLADEAHAISLFGGKRVLRIRARGARSIMPALEPVLATPPAETMIVIEAGDLRRTAPLRRRCEAARSAAALGCYAEFNLDGLIDEELKANGLTVADDARHALKRSIGADRIQSRSEIRKLCLYVGKGEVSLADVRAIVADAGESGMDDLLDAVALGDGAGMERAWRRLIAEGASPAGLIAAALRHFQLLHRAVGVLESGGGVGEAMGKMQMPMQGPRRQVIERQLRNWSGAALARAVERIAGTIAETRLNPALAASLTSNVLLALSGQARRRG